MATDAQTLISEAQELGLFKPQAAFEVHCANCHGRLDGRGSSSSGPRTRPAA